MTDNENQGATVDRIIGRDTPTDARWDRLEYVIEEAVPDDIPGWRFRYSRLVAEAVEAAGFGRPAPGARLDLEFRDELIKYSRDRIVEAWGDPINGFLCVSINRGTQGMPEQRVHV